MHQRCNQVAVESALVIDDPLLSRVQFLVTQIRIVNTDRNKIIHGTWMARPTGERIVIKNAHGYPLGAIGCMIS